MDRSARARSVELHASGRAALTRALTDQGSAGERVAVPAFACHAVAEAVGWAGAKPVSVDRAADSFMSDSHAFSSPKQARPVAWAIVPTTYGQSDIDLEAVPADVNVILDAACCGSRPLPALDDEARGLYVVWSFNFTSLARVGGGAVLHRGADRRWAERPPRARAGDLRRFADDAARAWLRKRIPRAFPVAARRNWRWSQHRDRNEDRGSVNIAPWRTREDPHVERTVHVV